MPTSTTHLGLTKPDEGQVGWDGLINDDLDIVDTAIGALNSAIATLNTAVDAIPALNTAIAALNTAIASIPALPTLATVATTGSYDDLLNRPTSYASITLIDTVTGLPVVITIADGALSY